MAMNENVASLVPSESPSSGTNRKPRVGSHLAASSTAWAIVRASVIERTITSSIEKPKGCRVARMAEGRVRVILNPRAGAGIAVRRLPSIEESLRRYELSHEILLTQSAGHATELARAAIADGVDVVAAVGGDGTLNEVVQAYLDEAGQPKKGP